MNLPQKFRPYFTPAELQEIIRCLKAAPTTSLPLLRYMESFSIKITHGTISPQYVAMPSLESRLGMEVQAIEPSPEELFQLWGKYPDKTTPAQMELIQQYRWERGMMDPMEQMAYEDSILASSSSTKAKKG